MLFLTEAESQHLGVFCEDSFQRLHSVQGTVSHSVTKYHNKCVERAGIIRAQLSHIKHRVDVKIDETAAKNAKENEKILPAIVEAVMLCTKQQIALRGHRDKIDFTQPPTANEGNFIALIRLLAEHNTTLI